MVADLLDADELAQVRRETDRIVEGAHGIAQDDEVYDFDPASEYEQEKGTGEIFHPTRDVLQDKEGNIKPEGTE